MLAIAVAAPEGVANLEVLFDSLNFGELAQGFPEEPVAGLQRLGIHRCPDVHPEGLQLAALEKRAQHLGGEQMDAGAPCTLRGLLAGGQVMGARLESWKGTRSQGAVMFGLHLVA
jgi:hypothetical protein